MQYPEDLKYTQNDEWIRVEGNVATIGITDYAQDQLSDIVYLEVTAAEGETLSAGDSFGTVESVKAAADIYTAVGGTVLEVNDDLADTPEMMNSDPYGQSWMIKLEIADPVELEPLMDHTAYEAYCNEREA
jgi:glycine cleavage system H protein